MQKFTNFSLERIGLFLLFSGIFQSTLAGGLESFERLKKAKAIIESSGKSLPSFEGGLIDNESKYHVKATLPIPENRGFDYYMIILMVDGEEKQINLKVRHGDGFPSVEEVKLFLSKGSSERKLEVFEIKIIR